MSNLDFLIESLKGDSVETSDNKKLIRRYFIEKIYSNLHFDREELKFINKKNKEKIAQINDNHYVLTIVISLVIALYSSAYTLKHFNIYYFLLSLISCCLLFFSTFKNSIAQKQERKQIEEWNAEIEKKVLNDVYYEKNVIEITSNIINDIENSNEKNTKKEQLKNYLIKEIYNFRINKENEAFYRLKKAFYKFLRNSKINEIENKKEVATFSKEDKTLEEKVKTILKNHKENV